MDDLDRRVLGKVVFFMVKLIDLCEDEMCIIWVN